MDGTDAVRFDRRRQVLTMLSGPQAQMLSKAAVGLGAVGGVVGAADIIAGQDSAANKLMDTAAMGY